MTEAMAGSPAGQRAYGAVTRALHWLMVAAIAAQFVVGYLLDDSDGQGRGRGGAAAASRAAVAGGAATTLEVFGDDGMLTIHVVLGLTILLLVVVRLWWRRTHSLPPWAETLSPAGRTLAHWTERVLYVLQLAIPLTGLWLVLVSDDAVAASTSLRTSPSSWRWPPTSGSCSSTSSWTVTGSCAGCCEPDLHGLDVGDGG